MDRPVPEKGITAVPAPCDEVFRAVALTKICEIGVVEVHALRRIDRERYSGALVVLLGPSGNRKPMTTGSRMVYACVRDHR